jgi:DNA (cytosine-5)-methyltransferase 1
VSRRKLLIADLFCGAGGTSTGIDRALSRMGLPYELVCINHWPVAIETHKLNHPKARHHVQDIATVRPHLIVPEGYLDLLTASPTCTHHSVARGGKPTSDQQRSDPWHIVTWLTELRVKRLLIENVWEFTGWGPVDARTGRPLKDRKGEYFRAWIDTIRRLGATDLDFRKLNAANYGTAQTRQRFIMKVRFDRVMVGWAPVTHAKREPGRLELFPGMKPWRPAREIIDWSIKGKSIFTRKKPLAPKTLARIYAGALKFGWPEPFLVVLRNHMAAQSVDGPLPTIAASGTHIGLAEPVIVNGRKGNQAKAVSSEPIPTLDTKGGVWLAEPLILNRNSAPRAQASPVSAPSPTVSCSGGGYVVEPFVLSRHAEGAPRSVEQPVPTQVAKQSHVLVSSYYGASQTAQSAEEPLPTVTTKDRFGIVVPITHAGGENRARSVDDPLNTITTANRGELAFIAAAFGEREGQAPRVHDIGQPAPAICAQGRVQLVEPDVSVDASRTSLDDASGQYDILFRMLEPHELAAAMGFSNEEAKYQFAGTKTEQIKQIGNAVPVEMVDAEVTAFFADVAAKKKAAAPREKRRASA